MQQNGKGKKMQVWVFGSGDCGQLAVDEDTWSQETPLEHPFFKKYQGKIIQIAAGGLHTLALDQNGRVFSWGCNDEQALGHEEPEFTVGSVQGLEDVQVVQVAAGDSISAVLSAQGQVYTWGTFRDSKGLLGHSSSNSQLQLQQQKEEDSSSLMQRRPVLIPGLVNIRSISAGSNHLFAINAQGELFSWGCGEQGQLGRRVLERHKHLGLRPTNVTPREGRHHVPITRVAPGAYHTLLVSQDGHLYVMGHNNYGQLGTGDLEPAVTARHLVDFPHFIQDAAAGEHHTLILTRTGDLYASGRNDAGELGIPEVQTHSTTFQKVPLPTAVRSIAAGGHHSLCITVDDQVYSWGYGEMYQLGLGHDQEVRTPTPIPGITGVPLQASCGAQHSVILSSSSPPK